MRTQTMCDRLQAQLDHDHLIKTCPQPTSTTYLGSTCLRSLKGELLATPGLGLGRGTSTRGVSEPNVWSYSLSWITTRELGLKAVFNETTHCVLLHSLSSFTFV